MGTTVRYELSATGFSSTDSLVMWYKVGEEYSQFPVTVEADGRLTIAIGDNARPGFSIFGYVDGQAFDVALVSSTTGQRAHGKTVPFPLRAESPGGCSIDAEVLTTSGLLFLMTLNGFAPDDSVTIRSEHRGEVIGSAQTVPASGVIGMPVLFERGSGGPATFSARSRSCEVLLQFTVGIDEMDVR